MRSLLKDQGQAMGATTRATVLLIHAARVADCADYTQDLISPYNKSVE